MLVIVGIQFDSRAFMMAGFARKANPANDAVHPPPLTPATAAVGLVRRPSKSSLMSRYFVAG